MITLLLRLVKVRTESDWRKYPRTFARFSDFRWQLWFVHVVTCFVPLRNWFAERNSDKITGFFLGIKINSTLLHWTIEHSVLQLRTNKLPKPSILCITCNSKPLNIYFKHSLSKRLKALWRNQKSLLLFHCYLFYYWLFLNWQWLTIFLCSLFPSISLRILFAQGDKETRCKG